ncbi:MAG: hypothetical protein RL204_654 [Bacteroidota bacterium]
MRIVLPAISFIIVIIVSMNSCRQPEDWNDTTSNDEWYSGGQQTVFITGAGAYSSAFPVMSPRNEFVHEVGDIAFEQTFVSGGIHNPGLGPVYNSVSCTSCHIADGRGTPVGPGTNIVSLLIRLSIDGQDPHGGPLGIPGFGGQLQQNSIFGTTAEADLAIIYSNQNGHYPDGTEYELRSPSYIISNAYTSLPSSFMYSPRIAPPVFGLGLLEAVSESSVLEYEDEFDSDNNGISGKANYTWDIQKQQMVLGRFGWKAAAPSVLQQSAGAYNEDMGITSFLFPYESSFNTPLNLDNQPEPEISDSLLYAVAHYVVTLAVPARRDVDDVQVQQGKKLFFEIGCESCHRSEMRTAVNVAFPELSNQRIFPYSDMLLHDMGELLADHRPDNLASGYEWRTPPLWGIGLTEVVNGHQNFLHDGRARSFEEAILWHGGEAESTTNRFKNLSSAERASIIRFLESL